MRPCHTFIHLDQRKQINQWKTHLRQAQQVVNASDYTRSTPAALGQFLPVLTYWPERSQRTKRDRNTCEWKCRAIWRDTDAIPGLELTRRHCGQMIWEKLSHPLGEVIKLTLLGRSEDGIRVITIHKHHLPIIVGGARNRQGRLKLTGTTLHGCVPCSGEQPGKSDDGLNRETCCLTYTEAMTIYAMIVMLSTNNLFAVPLCFVRVHAGRGCAD